MHPSLSGLAVIDKGKKVFIILTSVEFDYLNKHQRKDKNSLDKGKFLS